MSKDRRQKEEKKSLLSSIVKGVIGIGALAYTGYKVLDMYIKAEESSLMSKEEYEEEIEELKNGYIQVDTGKEIEIVDGELFNRELIEKDSNADKLFMKFLDSIEKIIEIPDKSFKIEDIEKIIPFENSGIENKSTYDYSVMSMLGGQAGRDYFIFEDFPDLRDIFTKEANNSSRNNRLWKNKYGEVRFKVNPKYYM